MYKKIISIRESVLRKRTIPFRSVLNDDLSCSVTYKGVELFKVSTFGKYDSLSRAGYIVNTFNKVQTDGFDLSNSTIVAGKNGRISLAVADDKGHSQEIYLFTADKNTLKANGVSSEYDMAFSIYNVFRKINGKVLLNKDEFGEKINAFYLSKYNKKLGQRIYKAIEKTANSMNSIGYCMTGVTKAFNSIGLVNLLGIVPAADATERLDKLTVGKNPCFVRIDISNMKDLENLPAGSVVIWNKGGKKPYGHISISDGKGNEISDHIEKQRIKYPNSLKAVYIPI